MLTCAVEDVSSSHFRLVVWRDLDQDAGHVQVMHTDEHVLVVWPLEVAVEMSEFLADLEHAKRFNRLFDLGDHTNLLETSKQRLVGFRLRDVERFKICHCNDVVSLSQSWEAQANVADVGLAQLDLQHPLHQPGVLLRDLQALDRERRDAVAAENDAHQVYYEAEDNQVRQQVRRPADRAKDRRPEGDQQQHDGMRQPALVPRQRRRCRRNCDDVPQTRQR